MTGRCSRCKEVNKLYIVNSHDQGSYCYDCKRVIQEQRIVRPAIKYPDQIETVYTNGPFGNLSADANWIDIPDKSNVMIVTTGVSSHREALLEQERRAQQALRDAYGRHTPTKKKQILETIKQKVDDGPGPIPSQKKQRKIIL
jgi:hypothetical protein